MDDVYQYLYALYSDSYAHWITRDGESILIKPLAVCNHKQIDKILKAAREDEDEEIILECMHSCIGCIGDQVPALDE